MHYLPARLVVSRQRWYITFYQTDPVSGKRVRHRDTFDLNRIPNIRERTQAARMIIHEINAKLPTGYPYGAETFMRTVSMPVPEAIEYALSMKSDLRPATLASYASTARIFIKFLQTKNLDHAPVACINDQIAVDYSDYMIRQKYSSMTHNNNITELHAIFTILVKRKVILTNPFSDIPKRKKQPKIRRPFYAEDARIILEYIRSRDVSVFIGCLLQYYCMIRPNEQRQLKVEQVDLNRSVIIIKESQSKNRKDQHVTIPDQLKEILIEFGVDKLGPHLFLLGTAEGLGRWSQLGKNTLSARHKMYLDQMYESEMLDDITGYEYYSWKDTGGDALADAVEDAVKLKNQFRHSSLDITQKYLSNRPKADPEIKSRHRFRFLKEDRTITRTDRTGS